MKVYVLTSGEAVYEESVTVLGVFSSKELAENAAPKGAVPYKKANWGQLWFRIESFEVDHA